MIVVARRVGGLENQHQYDQQPFHVARRVGGLEKSLLQADY